MSSSFLPQKKIAPPYKRVGGAEKGKSMSHLNQFTTDELIAWKSYLKGEIRRLEVKHAFLTVPEVERLTGLRRELRQTTQLIKSRIIQLPLF